jgi:hypothetical protein
MSEALTSEDRELLSSVLDRLLPAREDGRVDGAGALGLAAYLEQAAAREPELRGALAELLAPLAADGFARLAPDAQVARLAALAQQATTAFHALVLHSYRGYYSHPRVVEALGMEPRPPFPQGYSVPPTDFSLLDPVRARAKLYRDC